MSTTSFDQLTPTSYAMLGLLAVRPWTTYELAKQMQRSVHWFWPRAERKLYDEPKRLVACGLASVRTTTTGRRASSVYDISPAGLEALRAWLGQTDASPMQVEMEDMVRVFFADAGSPRQLRANLTRIGEHATVVLSELGAMAEQSGAGEDDFAQRRATNALAMELWVRLHEAVRDWSTWALDEAESWPVQRRGRREAGAGPAERGTELFAQIGTRIGQAVRR